MCNGHRHLFQQVSVWLGLAVVRAQEQMAAAMQPQLHWSDNGAWGGWCMAVAHDCAKCRAKFRNWNGARAWRDACAVDGHCYVPGDVRDAHAAVVHGTISFRYRCHAPIQLPRHYCHHSVDCFHFVWPNSVWRRHRWMLMSCANPNSVYESMPCQFAVDHLFVLRLMWMYAMSSCCCCCWWCWWWLCSTHYWYPMRSHRWRLHSLNDSHRLLFHCIRYHIFHSDFSRWHFCPLSPHHGHSIDSCDYDFDYWQFAHFHDSIHLHLSSSSSSMYLQFAQAQAQNDNNSLY